MATTSTPATLNQTGAAVSVERFDGLLPVRRHRVDGLTLAQDRQIRELGEPLRRSLAAHLGEHVTIGLDEEHVDVGVHVDEHLSQMARPRVHANRGIAAIFRRFPGGIL